MRSIGNIIWFILIGIWSGLAYYLLGLLWCITIIGIPFGKQCFKIGGLLFWPFGQTVYTRFSAYPLANAIWFILGGFGIALGFFIEGIILCITIIGIPFGKQCFKLAKLTFAPFGATY